MAEAVTNGIHMQALPPRSHCIFGTACQSRRFHNRSSLFFAAFLVQTWPRQFQLCLQDKQMRQANTPRRTTRIWFWAQIFKMWTLRPLSSYAAISKLPDLKAYSQIVGPVQAMPKEAFKGEQLACNAGHRHACRNFGRNSHSCFC